MSSFLENAIFDVDLSYFADGGPEFNTTVTMSNNGFETRKINFTDRFNYTINTVNRTNQNNNEYSITALQNFFMAVKGKAYGFRFKDFNFNKTNTATGNIDKDIITSLPNLQIYYKALVDGQATYKKIVKPVDNINFKVYKNNTLIIKDVNYTVDFTKGIITLISAVNLTIINITTGLNCVVTTSTNHGLNTGNVIYLTNLNTGNLLNNKAYTITKLTNTTFRLNNITNAALVTTGNVQKYLQPSDTIRWTGDFHLPVRFDTDKLTYGIDGGLLNITGLSVVELRQ